MCGSTKPNNFFFNDTATTEIYTLSLHDALPIFPIATPPISADFRSGPARTVHRSIAATSSRIYPGASSDPTSSRSEEHTSELQSRQYLVCRLLLEKKKHLVSKHHHPSLISLLSL